jgi:hypothetical protein
MKNSFMAMALRCISMTASNLMSKPLEGAKFLLLDDVIAFSELAARYHWLVLVNRYQYTLKLKNSMPINNLDLELEELMKGYAELTDYEMSEGDPFNYLVKKRGLTLDEIVKLHGEQQTCVNIENLEELVVTVSKYNFYYRYKKLFGPFFKEAEQKMQVIAKRDHWPGRGSWNSFVPKNDKQKKEFNLDCLAKYSQKPKEETISEKDIHPN